MRTAIVAVLIVAASAALAQLKPYDQDRPFGSDRPATAPVSPSPPAPFVERPFQRAQPRSYQREYPREYPPLNPPAFRKGDRPGEWRD